MAVTERTLRLSNALHAELVKITDADRRTLAAAWADAWDELEPDLSAILLELLVTDGPKISRAKLLRSIRLRRALAVIADQLDTLVAQSQVTITSGLRDVVDTAGAAQAAIIDTQLPPRSPLLDNVATWSRVDERQIGAMVRRSTEQITALHKPLSADAYAAARRELIRGIAAGTNPRATAQRIVARTEGAFNGGLQRALVIARTETADAHREGALLGRMANTDLLTGWTWLAALSPRTCRSCLAEHGKVHPVDEPGPLDHQQGRCTAVPTTRSWRDLGIDLDEPASAMPDAEAYVRSLPVADQQAILGGPDGHAAWAAGDWPIDAWSTRRTTDGWRDSMVPAQPPAA